MPTWAWYAAITTAALTWAGQVAWLVYFSKCTFKDSLFVLLALLAVGGMQLYASGVVDGPSGILLVPYLAWLIFALLMNAEMVQRNFSRAD